MHGVSVEHPLPGQGFEEDQDTSEGVTETFDLHPGDVAYIPRGCAHQASSAAGVSLHVTLGILSYTWTELLIEAVFAACLKDSELRKALPTGFVRDSYQPKTGRKMFERLWRQLSDSVDFDAALDHFAERFVDSRPPLVGGQLSQMRALGALDPASVVGARPGIVYALGTQRETLSLRCHGREIELPLNCEEAVQFALRQSRFQVAELPGKELDDGGKVTLVRRLIREGLVLRFL